MSGDRAAYQQAMREGHALAWEMKWEAAISRYRVATTQFPDDVAARSSLATALYRKGDLAEALEQNRALLNMAPGDEAALARVAEIQLRLGEVAGATEAYLALADRYLGSGQRAKAVQIWGKLAELLPNDLDVHERLYQVISKAGENVMAGKIGLAITRLRGEQDSRRQRRAAGINGQGKSASSGQTSPHSPVPELLASGLREAEQARRHEAAGSLADAVLNYARAATALKEAGAREELSAVEEAAAIMAAACGGSRFRDLLSVDEAGRRAVLESMMASQRQRSDKHNLAAIDECLTGICAAPAYLPLQERLADVLVDSGQTQEAVTRYSSLAELYLLRGQLTDAAESLEKSAALGHIERPLWTRLVDNLVDADDNDRAITLLVVLAERLIAGGQHQAAAEQLKRAVALAPTRVELRVRWARALEAAGDIAAALGAYETTLRYGDSVDAALRLGIVASLAGRFDTALEALARVLDSVVDGNGSLAEVVEAYRCARSDHAECVELQVSYGVVLAHAGNWSEAAAELRAAGSQRAEVAACAQLWLGRCALAEDRVEEALGHLAAVDGALRGGGLGAGDASERIGIEHERLRGELSIRRGELDQAVLAFGEVKRLCPSDRRVRTQLAEAHFRRGDTEAAATELMALGDLHTADQHQERALSGYLGATQLAPEDAMPRVKLAETYMALGRLSEALGAMDELSRLLATQGEIERAAEVLRQMIEHCRQSDPALTLSLRERLARLLADDAEARQQVIAAYLNSGRSDAALAEATRLWHDMIAADRLDGAAAALQQLLQIDPWNADALLGLGRLNERRGDRTGAIEAFRRVLAADGENSEAAERLAELTSPEAQ